MALNLSTATFAGVIEKITPRDRNYEGDPDKRPWNVFIKVELPAKQRPIVFVKFVTAQEPVPWLIAQKRLDVGSEITVMGSISSIAASSRFDKSETVVHLSNAQVLDQGNLHFDCQTVYSPY